MFALIVFFTYFYTALVFNPIDLADNLRKNGGFIPGVRPGTRDGALHRERAEPHHAPGRAVPRRHRGRPDACCSTRPTTRSSSSSAVRRS